MSHDEQEGLLQWMMQQSGLSIWEYDHSHDRVKWSPALCTLLGCRTDSAPWSLDDWLDLVHPEDRAALQHALKAEHPPGSPWFAAGCRIKRHGGDWAQIHLRGCVAERTQTGNTARCVGTITAPPTDEQPGSASPDRGPPLVASQARAPSEALLQATLASAAEGILIIDRQRKVLRANPRFQEMWRVSDELLAEGQDERLLAYVLDQLTDPQGFLQEIERLYETDAEQHDVVHFKDGRVYERFTRSILLPGQNARLWSFRDVTEKTRAVEHLERIAALAPGVIYSFRMRPDGSVNFPYTSPTTAALYDLRPEDLERDGAIVWSMIHPDDIDRLRAGIEASARDLSLWHDEVRVMIPSKGERWIAGHAVPEREPDGSTLWHGFLTDVTDRKRIDQLLAEEATRRRILFEHSKDGIVVLDTEGAVYEMNPRFADMLGYSLEEAQALHVWDWDLQWNQPELLHKLKTDPDVTFETRHRRKDGSVYDVEISTNLVDWHGTMLRFCVSRDISQRKTLQDQLRQRERYLRAVIDNFPFLVWLKDPEGHYLAVNAPFAESCGQPSPEAVVGKSDLDVWPIELAERYRADDRWVLASGRSKNVEEPLEGSDGRTWIETYKSPITLDGRAIGTVGFARDVSERREMETRLRESESRYRSLFEAAGDGILILRDARVVDCNNKALELYGGTKQELIGLTPEQLSPVLQGGGLTSGQFAKIHIDAALAGQPQFFEWRHRRTDGSELDCEISLSVLEGDGETLLQAIIRDVSERKRAERALLESRQLLQTIIDTVPVRVFWKDRALRYLGCNPAFARDAGVPRPEDLIGKDDYQLPWKDQAARYRADDSRVLKYGVSTLGYEEPQTTPDGRCIWLRTSKVPLINQAHERIGVLGVYEDVTERKLAELQVRIAAAAFEAQESMVVTNLEGVILKVNRAFTQATGYRAEEAVGRKMNLINSGRHDAAFHASMWEAIRSIGFWQGEIWNRRKDGEVHPDWVTITAVRDDNGVVTHYVGTLTDITQRRAAEDEIKHLAFYDPLTQLPNRRLLLDRLRQALVVSAREQRSGALLFIDLDNFKTLNDTLGHDRGDVLLQQVAERLSACVRGMDTVARLGGDEFVVMLQELNDDLRRQAAQAEAIGEKILASLNQPYRIDGKDLSVTPSIGITLFANHGATVDELLKQADLAMYQAKAAGRNTLRFFDPAMQAALEEHAALETALRLAIQQRQLLLYYQPQVDHTGRITGAEALLRWPDPLRGLVPPTLFIPLAEETGLIQPLGRWIIETACRQLAAWAKEPQTAGLTMAVNVSARQFHHTHFVDQVVAALAATGVDPHRLTLEITESLLAQDIDEIITKMDALKSLGVRFSLDDFGTGYSSLHCLKRLPLDQLKIAQSFVRDVLTDPNDAAIARTILSLGRTLGLDVIAEGVETDAQRRFLVNEGCQAFQGYLFGEPAPISALQPMQASTDSERTVKAALAAALPERVSTMRR